MAELAHGPNRTPERETRSRSASCASIQSVEVVLAHAGADRLDPPPPLARLHRQRGVDRLRLTGDVERIDRERPFAERFVRAGVLGEDQHAVAAVHERRLLRDEIQPVEDGVDEQRVVLLVRRDRLREVVGDLQVDGHPPVALRTAR